MLERTSLYEWRKQPPISKHTRGLIPPFFDSESCCMLNLVQDSFLTHGSLTLAGSRRLVIDIECNVILLSLLPFVVPRTSSAAPMKEVVSFPLTSFPCKIRRFSSSGRSAMNFLNLMVAWLMRAHFSGTNGGDRSFGPAINVSSKCESHLFPYYPLQRQYRIPALGAKGCCSVRVGTGIG